MFCGYVGDVSGAGDGSYGVEGCLDVLVAGSLELLAVSVVVSFVELTAGAMKYHVGGNEDGRGEKTWIANKGKLGDLFFL